MRDILIVTKFTMRELLRKKSFIVTTIIIILMIIGASFISKLAPNMMGKSNKSKILIVDNDNIFENQLEKINNLNTSNEFIVSSSKLSLEEIKNKVKNKEVDKGILIYKQEEKIKIDYIVENNSLMMNTPSELQKALSQIYSENKIKKLGLTESQIKSLEPNFEYTIISSKDKDANKNISIIMILSAILFSAINAFAYQVSTSITSEKTSKIVETLVTYTKPKNIVIGKTLGVGLVGLLQLSIILLISLLSINLFVDKNLLSSMLDLSTITPSLGILIIVYFLLGYMEYALLYALTGAFVSNPEEVKSAATPVSLIAVFSFYLAYLTMMSPTSNINYISSMVPFSSPFSAPFRVMLGISSIQNTIISIAILIITNIIIAHIAIKIYTNAIINNGTKFTIKELIKMYKAK